MGCTLSRKLGKKAPEGFPLYVTMSPPWDVHSLASKMGTTLPAIKSAAYLDWSHKPLNAADCKAIEHLAASGCLTKLKEIKLVRAQLDETVIGRDGKKALANAVASGNLPLLDGMWLA